MPARNAKPYKPQSSTNAVKKIVPRDLVDAVATTIDEVQVFAVGKYRVDLIVGGRPAAAQIYTKSGNQLLENYVQNVSPLPVDPGFYATLDASGKADYLRLHVIDGVRRGRILWHRTRDGRSFLTLPSLNHSETPEGYYLLPVYEVRRSKDGVWSKVA